jgi:hypothetical protein
MNLTPGFASRPEDPKMKENEIGKIVVDAADERWN